jgi:putative SOS response-associated peptidase YedK
LRAATFNARVETVAEKPFFRDAFRRTRCLIPASGYYEWQDTTTGKQPWYFTRADGEPMTFAGLWDEWKDKTTGEVLKSCTMLTYMRACPSRMLQSRSPMAAFSAAGRLPQSITRSLGTPSNY